MQLKDKVAIITGSRRGIGKGIALEMAKRGARVVVTDIDQDECEQVADEIKSNGGQTMAFCCDVSQENQVQDLVLKTKEAFGSLDIMVNNAGILLFKDCINTTVEDFEKIINVDLKGVFLGSREAAKVMIEQGSGKIINIASIAALIGYRQLSVYCAAKGGVAAFTRALALELAPTINVNAIAPGAIDTPMANVDQMDGATKKGMLMRIPKGRIGQPEDIAYTACFLASDEADYITGQTIVIDGGWTIN